MKHAKSSMIIALLAATAGSLASCGKKKGIEFWSSFGGAYTSVLDGITEKVGDKIGTNIIHTSKGSYDKVKEEMMSAIADASYPSLVTGYPDHFAEYLGNFILEPLDELVKTYDAEHGTDLLSDYLPAYMEENYDLDVDSNGNKVLSALPFNKSTELMGYNGTFVDYCKSLKEYETDDLGTVPSTWQEWETKGPKYREILTSLSGTATSAGKVVYGIQDVDGHTHDFEVVNSNKGETYNGKKLLLDFTNVDVELTRVISWDSTDNMFITLVRQWGAEYTRLTAEQKKVEPLYRKGDIMFVSEENKPKVIECLKFFNRLNKQHIFGVPKEFQQSYNSTAFENNQVMFMLCSSGGLSYNTAKWENRFRVAPLPYNSAIADGKYVISQGADITLTNNTNDFNKSFEAMVEMTTGELQAEWCLQTGYYPCSVSATNAPAYQAFLHEADEESITKYMQDNGVSRDEAVANVYSSPTRVAYREGSNINQDYYMKAESGWHKFVDPAFVGSSDIRTLIKTIFESVFIKISASDVDNDSKYSSVLEGVVTDPTIKQKAQNINVVR